ncbi:Flp family type IVb pilin [Pantoea sp. BAV 3049]|uniref:Flp family type IVb pilin n=1 Tax=Pantoea sp. BAV 3049 TaxID=2654188 RepID=UPI00131C37BF|nr:Flp family type IVb pilin [Pantoea sp. BAV 3049]
MKSAVLSSSVKIHEFVTCLRNKFAEFAEKQEGVTAIEYAVIAVAISGMLMVVFGSGDETFIGVVKSKFTDLTSNLKSINTGK